MFFLIRCVFWLAIVFSSMTWAVGPSQPQPHAFRDAMVVSGLAAAGAAKDMAVDEAKAWCVKAASQCLDDASRLSALVIANQAEDTLPDDTDRAERYPLPPADPRRHPKS